MTYWVIARFDRGIYMAADVRASRAAHGDIIDGAPEMGHRSYADTSEKLFHLTYVDERNRTIRLGLCTSGYASGYGETIVNILNGFLSYIRSYKVAFENGATFIDFLVRYIRVKYVSEISPHCTLGMKIIDSTNFGVGLFIEGQPFIASWNCKAKAVNSHNDVGYLEAAFSFDCLRALYNSQNVRAALNGLEKTQAPYSTQDNCLDFVKNIICTAAGTDIFGENAVQSISADTVDTVVITATELRPTIHPKQDVNRSEHTAPFTYGSDRQAMPSCGTWIPVNLIGLDRELMGMSQSLPQLYPSAFTPRFQQTVAYNNSVPTISFPPRPVDTSKPIYNGFMFKPFS
jgi:hypothetical protein